MTVLNREKSRGQGQEEEDEKGVAAFDRSFIELVGRSCQLEGWNPPRDSLYGLDSFHSSILDIIWSPGEIGLDESARMTRGVWMMMEGVRQGCGLPP